MSIDAEYTYLSRILGLLAPPEQQPGVLQQVDEEVGGAVEHGEEVRQLRDVLDPVGPQQLPLQHTKSNV
jgi:hypothetical protein